VESCEFARLFLARTRCPSGLRSFRNSGVARLRSDRVLRIDTSRVPRDISLSYEPMFDWLGVLSSREQAILIWICITCIALIVSADMRPSLLGVVQAVLAWKISSTLAAAAVYVAACAFVLDRAGVWYDGAPKDVVVWFLVQGLALFFSFQRAGEPGFVRTTAIRSLQGAAIVEFLVNFYTFPLLVEFALIPLIVAVAALRAVSEMTPEHAPVTRLLDGLLVAFGTGLLVWALVRGIAGWHQLISTDTIQAFLLPAVLAVTFLPFVYTFAVCSAYGQIFWRLGCQHRSERRRWVSAKIRILLECGLDLRRIQRFTAYALPTLTSIRDDQELRALLSAAFESR
jgi:hypothetical protein